MECDPNCWRSCLRACAWYALSADTDNITPPFYKSVGLLNVLDGVVDTPNRIVIMTTNHVSHILAYLPGYLRTHVIKYRM